MVDTTRHRAIRSAGDAEWARTEARSLARALGFDVNAAEALVIATMELTSNLLRHAIDGSIALSVVERAGTRGVRLESVDRGPGIEDTGRALEDGYSTGGGLGCGLPAVRRLMDSFDLTTGAAGTRIVAVKWPG